MSETWKRTPATMSFRERYVGPKGTEVIRYADALPFIAWIPEVGYIRKPGGRIRRFKTAEQAMRHAEAVLREEVESYA